MTPPSQESIVAASRQNASFSNPGPKRKGCRSPAFRYPDPVNYLTKQEQWVLCVILGLLLTGWLVKTYRAAHPPATATRRATP
jgi:hypothetical protein